MRTTHTWLDPTRWLRHQRTAGHRPQSQNRKECRLLIEDLETRTVPSIDLALLSPTLMTDRLDYAPGSMAMLTGTGFSVGGAVQLSVMSSTGSTSAWQVMDGSACDLDGLANGNFQTTWDVGYGNVGATMMATAIDMTTGAMATAKFTDSSGAIWTTNSTGARVDQNLYETKADVYLNGGPNNPKGGDNLPDGSYFVWVTEP